MNTIFQTRDLILDFSSGTVSTWMSGDDFFELAANETYIVEWSTPSYILAPRSVSGFYSNASYGGLYSTAIPFGSSTPTFSLNLGDTCSVYWDGKTYDNLPVKDGSMFGSGGLYVGNGAILGLEGNGEPFVIGWLSVGITFLSLTDTLSSHDVAIYQPMPTIAYNLTATEIDLGNGSGVVVGNLALLGAGENTGEPFLIGGGPDGALIYGGNSAVCTMGISQIVPEPEPEPDVGVVLKDRDGNPHEYYGVNAIKVNTTDGGTQIFAKGIPIDGVEIIPDFSEGDHSVTAPDGYLVRSAIVKKPEKLEDDNIAYGVEIAGVGPGKFTGYTETTVVELNFSDNDVQTITPSESHKVLSQVTIAKPDDLKPENIAEGIVIAGVEGTFKGGGGDSDFDATDENLKYILYNIDTVNKEILVTGFLDTRKFSETGSYDLTIPDKIGGYQVVIASNGVR